MEESMVTAETAAQSGEAPAVTQSGLGSSLIMAGIALVLIYALTANIQKIAAFVDKLFGKGSDGGKPDPERVGDYKVYDIYEGEMNLDDNDKKE